jgi:hypothetical protein
MRESRTHGGDLPISSPSHPRRESFPQIVSIAHLCQRKQLRRSDPSSRHSETISVQSLPLLLVENAVLRLVRG